VTLKRRRREGSNTPSELIETRKWKKKRLEIRLDWVKSGDSAFKLGSRKCIREEYLHEQTEGGNRRGKSPFS